MPELPDILNAANNSDKYSTILDVSSIFAGINGLLAFSQLFEWDRSHLGSEA